MVRKKKELIPPSIEQSLDLSNLNPIYGKKSYQVFCPKCNFGPMFSIELKFMCSACRRTILLTKMPDQTYKVTTVE